MPSGAGQLSSGGGQGRGAGATTAEPSWVAERPRRRDPGAVGPPSAWSPGAGMSGRRSGRSLPCPPRPGPPWGCPSNRSSGHPASTGPVSRRPVSTGPVSRRPVHSGVRTDRPAVSAALPPRCPRRAGSGAARCGRPPGWAQPVDVPRGRRAAWSPARIGPDGKGWCCVGRRWLAGGSTADLGRRIVGAQAAAPPRRLADKGAGPAHGCWSVGWGARERVGAHQSPQLRPGQVAGVVPDHGAGPGGDDHAAWSLGEGWSGGVQLRRAHSVRPGADCGRSAAAAREECCPSGAHSALTSENSGGRDRV